MQHYPILFALASAAVCHAQGPQPAAQNLADARAVVSRTAAPVTAMAAPRQRQLSAEERAELRRQLYQFSRLSGKGS